MYYYFLCCFWILEMNAMFSRKNTLLLPRSPPTAPSHSWTLMYPLSPPVKNKKGYQTGILTLQLLGRFDATHVNHVLHILGEQWIFAEGGLLSMVCLKIPFYHTGQTRVHFFWRSDVVA